MTSGGTCAERRLRERRLTLLALVAGSAIGIVVTLWLAVGWAADQPKTIEFAIAREPFGSRSLLERGNARETFDDLLGRLDDDDRVTDLHLTARSLSAMARTRHDRRRSLFLTVEGEVTDHLTIGGPEGRGVPLARIAALDLDAALEAAQRRWRELGTHPEPPLLSLQVRGARPRGWLVIFTSEVPADERTTAIDLEGRVRR
ncbi:hypothetical protein [Conexibacter arvalis]|uniref:Uncharacterized protein n=1 Tax=Conexibacter arvalis TaxID=912552 RepID=A0A840IGJ6_9ACTN|nr:hypothetical protein [Conexibacter arvalis]MBB4663088.1 hypothetical protein [Conexibacter arvalis]